MLRGASQMARHERRGRVDEQVVHVVAALVPDLERVAKALGGEQSRPRALALDQRVRGQRGAVNDRADAAGIHARVVQQRLDALLDAMGGILGGRQHLADADGAGDLVDDDEIGERAADVHAAARRHGGEFTPRWRAGGTGDAR